MTEPVRHAVLLADGEAPARAILDASWPGWDEGIDLVIAADGGLRHAASYGLRVDRWVGDGDSTTAEDLAELAASGAAIERVATDKDESDTELAVLAAARAAGADAVTILGALGGPRTDHAIANLALLQHEALAGRRVRLYDQHGARLSILAAPDDRGLPAGAELTGSVGDLVSLLPIGDTAHEVTTEGLRYPLASEDLVLGQARGLSNVRTAPVARVTLRSGRILVVETPARLRP